jgi:hypothetical protein
MILFIGVMDPFVLIRDALSNVEVLIRTESSVVNDILDFPDGFHPGDLINAKYEEPVDLRVKFTPSTLKTGIEQLDFSSLPIPFHEKTGFDPHVKAVIRLAS